MLRGTLHKILAKFKEKLMTNLLFLFTCSTISDFYFFFIFKYFKRKFACVNVYRKMIIRKFCLTPNINLKAVEENKK